MSGAAVTALARATVMGSPLAEIDGVQASIAAVRSGKAGNRIGRTLHSSRFRNDPQIILQRLLTVNFRTDPRSDSLRRLGSCWWVERWIGIARSLWAPH